ncbi:non-ribosomal peptide synthetase [Myxococcus fulvus]|uniref:non-ribosomal peptide synthetase n=1 Tax=Myxococcus fulvus TaxID=33 RepID=UPI0020BF3C6B|nr:amino acid adenylation domain-containing protein [Myxococcus fulvus]MCK8498050.1 amino acid adenylation domain-containing protein [Myxococcus fulvus]
MTATKDTLELLNSLSPEKRAQVLKSLKQEALQTQSPRIARRADPRAPVPVSLAQNRLWLFEQLRPGGHAYNEVSALRLEGTLDVAVLEQSLQEIVRRHEVLRTSFAEGPEGPVQIITPTVATRLHVVDLAGLAEAEQSRELQRLIDAESRRPFDLTKGALLRTTLFQLGARKSVLLTVVHHIVLDGWSIGVFQRELAELYRELSAGRPSPLRELPIQYADYAVWQRQWMKDDVLQRQLEYWTRQLKDAPPLLTLPFANPRPETERFAGAREYFTLDEQVSKGLSALSRRLNASLFMTLLATFQTLLHRYTGQTDIPVGTVVANREQPELEQLIGFFVNTLVLRGDLGGNPRFEELVERTRATALAAFEHQSLPFEKLVDALKPERSLGYNPLFQVMFILQNMPAADLTLPGLTLSPLEIGSVTAKYDLTLVMDETPHGLHGHWEYNSDLFDADTIRRMSGHLEVLLRAVVENGTRPLAELPLLPEAEERRLLVEWNQTQPATFPLAPSLHRLFEDQATRTPEAVAVAHAGQRLSYRELDERANQLAHHLRGLGVGPGKLVGVCLQRAPELLVALLGVLKAGGAYMPLDPSYPPLRLGFMLEDSKAAVLVTQDSLRTRFATHGAQVVCVDGSDLARQGKERPTPLAGEHDLAYVIYTSGSTGMPKGVQVTHRNVVHSTIARWTYYREPVSSFLLLSSYAFDSSVAGIFWTLSQGGTLVLPEGEGLPDLGVLGGLISAHRVSHLLCIPSVYSLLLQQARPEDLASLKTVMVAGETCPPRLFEQHRRVIPSAALYNEYGPTEATVWCTVHRLEEAPRRASVPIGRPISDTRIYLLDAHLHPVPIGVPGELHVGGPGVTRGYLNHPELTAARFIRDPSSQDTEARLYKTGDLARYLPDGSLEFLGRVDDQVKVRGFRVELGEVEAVLSRLPSVREAVVAVRDDERENKRLVGYVVADAGVSLTALREAALQQLPSHAVPSELVQVDSLPRLPNGKVDRRSLPAPETLRVVTQAASQAQWTELQRTIAALWKEAINVESVSLDDNFFQIGGDSLSVVRVFNRLRESVDKELSITHLFKHPTIRALSAFIEP